MTQLKGQRIGVPVSWLVVGTDRSVVEHEVMTGAVVVAAIACAFQRPGTPPRRRLSRRAKPSL